MKYIIELDEIPNTGLFKARGANTLVFDKKGIENILKPYEEEPEIDWYKVAVDTPILVKNSRMNHGIKSILQNMRMARYVLGIMVILRGQEHVRYLGNMPN